MGGKKKKRVSNKSNKPENAVKQSMSIRGFEKQPSQLSNQELKELLLINMYKLALTRAQLEAVTNILIKKKIATFEEVWKQTNENFKNTI